MNLAIDTLTLPFLMDILAITASAILIVFLICNRRRYGHLTATPRSTSGGFASEMDLEMARQQSQSSLGRIQQALNQELANLQRLSGRNASTGPTTDSKTSGGPTALNAVVSPRRPRCYEEAARMIRNGADRQEIARRCRLTKGEIDLLHYLTQKGA